MADMTPKLSLNSVLYGPQGHTAACCALALAGLLLLSSLINTAKLLAPEPVPSTDTLQLTTTTQGPSKLAAWHLFGGDNASDLPATQLQLSLIGLFVGEPKQNSVAIITAAQHEEKRYSIGDILPGGAKITDILNDAVILEHDGKMEQLTLAKHEIVFAPLPSTKF
jgi:general secretion pathway protein C